MKVTNYENLRRVQDVLDDTETKTCRACGGSGWEDEYDELECMVCFGEGEVPA